MLELYQHSSSQQKNAPTFYFSACFHVINAPSARSQELANLFGHGEDGLRGLISRKSASSFMDGRIVDLDNSLALVVAELSYELKLPLPDSIILATARANNATLWTQDAHFERLNGVKYIEKKG